MLRYNVIKNATVDATVGAENATVDATVGAKNATVDLTKTERSIVELIVKYHRLSRWLDYALQAHGAGGATRTLND